MHVIRPTDLEDTTAGRKLVRKSQQVFLKLSQSEHYRGLGTKDIVC